MLKTPTTIDLSLSRTLDPRRLTAGVRTAVLVMLLGLIAGCVYRVDVQQGNILKADDVDAVQVGMTRTQVRFLLGTPIARNPFREDRWDYMYSLKPGNSSKATQRWVIVWFDGDAVREVTKDVPIEKSG